MVRVCWSGWQAPNVAVFVCTSALCGAATVPATAVATPEAILATQTDMCAAFRQTLAAQYGLPLESVTLTKCQLTVLPTRRMLAEPGRKQLERSLQTASTRLCVRASGALLMPWRGVRRADTCVGCV